MDLDVTCCFCGLGLTHDESVVIVVYPLATSDELQNLFCHRDCMTRVIHPSILLHPDITGD